VSTPAATANAGSVHRLRLDDELLAAVTERAQAASPGRTALAIVGGLLFAIGWVVAKAAHLAFYCSAWSWAAVAVGWRQARGEAPRGPSAEQLLAENDALRKALARIEPTLS
jgi:hypothetical protein